MKLKTRVKLTVFFLVALVVVLNTGIITAYISGSLKENAVQSIQSVNQQTLITFDNLLDSFGTMSQLPLMDREIYEILNKDYEKDYEDKVRRFYLYRDMDTIDGKLYAEMFYRNEYVYSVTLIPFNTDVVYSKQRFCKTARYDDASGRDWFQTLIHTNGKEPVLLPQMKDDLYLGEEPIISVGRLLINHITDQGLGVLRIDIAVKDLEKIWNRKNFAKESEFIVLDENDRLLYSSLPAEKLAKQEYKDGELSARGGESMVGTVTLDREKRLAICTQSSKYGVTMITMVPEHIIYADAYRTIFLIVMAGLFCIALAFIAANVLTKGIMKPIAELNGLMKEVRGGNLEVRSTVEGAGDFEEICGSFNSMVKTTKELIDKIYREQAEKREMEYQALQAQISPHFTLNTLNTIKWLACLQGNRSIEKALDCLANILTFAVRERREKIPISLELRQMESYIQILTLRYCNKFDIEYEVDEGLYNNCTLKYMLQTIVENSVFHGFDEMEGQGLIRVKIYESGGRVIYEIWDNGKGMTAERIRAVLQGEKKAESGVNHIGIYNIDRRIKLIFGEEYGISIESKYGTYTLVKIEIPREVYQEENGGKDNDQYTDCR
ncbi:cache domain-containing sensor histidine kinase [Hungatella sp.]|uniref:cache domain-containing sensor histidine kinase n=1 Tax=Hungatella sp. TaxID=2613924 RepID=UPI003AB2139D